MTEIFWWIPFAINFLLYGICCLLIIKRKTLTIISIRSPTLLLTTIIGNFLMSLIIILYKIIGQNFFSSFYYLFRAMMIVSLILRYERIIICCGINKNDVADLKQFYDKRYIFTEKFYVRVLMIVTAIILVPSILTPIFDLDYFEVFFTNKNSLDTIKISIWVGWNFLEQFIIITYLFRMYYIINPKHFIKFELYFFLIIWIIYTNFISVFAYYYNNNNNDAYVLVSLGVLYISLILNGYFPVIISFISKTLVTYHFTFKLMNNLYLFLTNESCYESFNNYLKSKKDDNGPFFLKLYTYIMKYKLDFTLNANNRDLGFSNAVKLNNTFFEDESYVKIIEPEVLHKVKNECKSLNNNMFTKNMFDDALQYAYDELNKRFNDFKNSREYNELQAKISIESYINCKMCNIGLINKF